MIELIFLFVLALLVYSYLVYPLIGVIIGFGRVERAGDELPAVSMLVPAYNESAVIDSKIRNFLDLDYPRDRIELLIADDGSTDGTAAILKQHEGDVVRVLHLGGRQGKAAAMNRLVEESQYPLLLFSDANVLLARNAVRRLVDDIGNPDVGAVTGEVRLIGSDSEFSTGESLYYWLERRIQGAESRIGSVMGVDGGMYLIRRRFFRPLPVDTILDDFTVSMNVMRARQRVVYENAARATESGTPTARQEFARRARIAAGAVQLIKRGTVPRFSQPVLWFQFFSHKLLRWSSPILFAILFVTNILLLNRGLWFQLALAGQLIIYGTIFFVWLFPLLRKTSVGGVLFYFGISQVAMAVGLGRGILNRQPARWEKGLRNEQSMEKLPEPVIRL